MQPVILNLRTSTQPYILLGPLLFFICLVWCSRPMLHTNVWVHVILWHSYSPKATIFILQLYSFCCCLLNSNVSFKWKKLRKYSIFVQVIHLAFVYVEFQNNSMKILLKTIYQFWWLDSFFSNDSQKLNSIVGLWNRWRQPSLAVKFEFWLRLTTFWPTILPLIGKFRCRC